MTSPPSSLPAGELVWRRLVKWLFPCFAILFGLAYLIYLTRQGQVHFQEGAFLIRTKDYVWSWVVNPALAGQWLGAVLFILLTAPRWPSRLTPSRIWMQAAAAGLALFLTGALVLTQWLRLETLEWIYLLPLAIAAFLVAAFLICPTASAPPPAERLSNVLARGGGGIGLRLGLFLAAVCVIAASWRLIYWGHPIVTDSQSQIAQARLILTGHWRLDISQALRDVIAFPYAIPSAPSYSQYPPGYILPIVPLLALRLPAQALDILVGALTILMTAGLARRLAKDPAKNAAGLAAAVLLLGSPFFIAMSGSGMNHTLAAWTLIAAAWCFMPGEPQKAGTDQRFASASLLFLLGGLCLGWAIITRPVTGFAHAIVWGGVWLGWMAQAWKRDREKGGPAAAPLRPIPIFPLKQHLWTMAGIALPIAVMLFYNARTTGHYLRMGYQVSNPALHRLGFIFSGPFQFTPLDAIHHLAANLLSLNFNLFGWAIGSWTLMLVWWIRSPLGRGERILAIIIAVQMALYTLYNFHDLFLGPRFLYELLPMFAVLAAAGLAPALAGGGRRAGVLWIVLILFSLGGLGTGMDFWRGKFGPIVARHEQLARFMHTLEPLKESAAIVLDEPAGEMIGRYFPASRGRLPLWFVLQDREAQARALPELAGVRWLYFPPKSEGYDKRK